jgi:hypothetical protein
MHSVVFLDTSVMLNILDVPYKNSDRVTVLARFTDLVMQGVTLIIPIAAIVEVGNHLAQLTGEERRDRAVRFAEMLSMSLQGQTPWVVSGTIWDPAFLGELVEGHTLRPGMVDLCTTGVGTGDGSILLEVERYRQRSDLPSGLPVELWSLDKGLQAYG